MLCPPARPDPLVSVQVALDPDSVTFVHRGDPSSVKSTVPPVGVGLTVAV